jgi:ribosomal-protein-alanine N-acetyltransferase
MIEILKLQYEYCEQVYNIARDCLPEHWSLEGIKDVLKYNNNIYYVAIETGTHKVIGFGGIMIVADEAELLNIAVDIEYRNKGIANKLMKKLISDAILMGAQRRLLEVRAHNDSARCFYHSNGFTELGLRKNYYDNPSDDAIIMEKILNC